MIISVYIFRILAHNTTADSNLSVDHAVQLLRSKSGNLSAGDRMEKHRPSSIRVENDLESSLNFSVTSREPSQSIKAGVDASEPMDSVISSLTARCSEDVSLREQNQVSPATLGIVTTTQKYGSGSPCRTPRSFRRDGSSASGRTVTARSGGGSKPPTPRNRTTPIRELDRMAIESKAPPRFTCPISGRVMRDPVILTTGTTCDRCALERRLANGNKRCPVSNKNLRVPISMKPNSELRDAITVWARKFAPWMLDSSGMFLLVQEPGRYEIQGSDNQYVCTPGAASPNRTPSRIESGKGSWVYTNGMKARPGHGSFNMNATPGTLESGRVPWYVSRGIASPRSSRKMSRTKSRRGGSGSPKKSKRSATPGDWYSLIFLIAVSAAYLGMFLFSVSLNDWKIAPMSENPWYGASPDALVEAGAMVLPLMNSPGNQWWRLISSIFLPAGLIQFFVVLIFLWLFGHPCRKALPWPQMTVGTVFLTSSLIGSLLSANLNGVYVSCGTFSGVLSMITVFCIDQASSWPHNRLFNLKEWWLVALLMTAVIGGFIAISLFPMVDVWFSLGGIIGGLCLGLILMLLPRVQSQALGGRKKIIWTQAVSGLVLLGVVVAASVGLALNPKLGESVSALQSISCIEMSSSMKCIQYGYLEDGCGLKWSHDQAEVQVACPVSNGYKYHPSNASFIDIGNESIAQMECQRHCDGRGDAISIISVPPTVSVTLDDLVAAEPAVAPAELPEEQTTLPEKQNEAQPPVDISSLIVGGQPSVEAVNAKPPVGMPVQLTPQQSWLRNPQQPPQDEPVNVMEDNPSLFAEAEQPISLDALQQEPDSAATTPKNPWSRAAVDEERVVDPILRAPITQPIPDTQAEGSPQAGTQPAIFPV
jgi:membrane associated rhomboid family serine protease